MVSKRLQIIKQKAEFLRNVRDTGIDLQRQYKPGSLVYEDGNGRFGHVVCNCKYYITVEFPNAKMTFFRKPGWRPCKEQYLRDNFRLMSNKDLAKVLDCSEKIIEKKLSKLKLKRNFIWDDSKDAFLIAHLSKPNQWLSQSLGTTVSSIKGRVFRLKSQGKILQEEKPVVYTWTDEADCFLRDNLHLSNSALAKHLSIPLTLVKSRLRRLRNTGFIPETCVRPRGKRRAG